MHRRIRAALIVLILVIAVLILDSGIVTRAQGGGTLAYGSKVFGRILADSPVVMYSFTGAAGDLVQVTARNWVGTLDPHLDLVAPDGQLAGVSAANPFGDDSLEAGLGLFLPQTGIYVLLVSAEGGTTGEYALELQGRGMVSATPLIYGQPVTASVATATTPQYYAFEAEDCPTVFVVANQSTGQPFTFPYLAKVRNEAGVPIAVLRGGDSIEDRLILAPLSGRYEVTVNTDDPAQAGEITLLVTCLDAAPGCVSGGPGGGGCGPDGVPLTCFEEGSCEAFAVTATVREDGNVDFTWPAVEGAQWYIFSVVDFLGFLLEDSPISLEGETSHTYRVAPEDMVRGPFTAFVQAGGETPEGEIRCIDEVTFSFDGRTTEQCRGLSVRADIVPGARMAVASWSAAPGAGAYLIHVYAYADDGGLIGIRVLTVPGSATTYHLDGVFPNEYYRFNIKVAAYENASGGGAFGDMPTGFLCDGSTDIEFPKAGPVEWGPAAGS